MLERILDSNAYRVQPVDGSGRVKTANRIDLLDCTFLESTESNIPASNADVESSSDSDSDVLVEWSDSDHSLEVTEVVEPVGSPIVSPDLDVSQGAGPPPTSPTPTHTMGTVQTPVLPQSPHVPKIRRSRRKTAGKHSNAHNLPKSVLNTNVKEIAFRTLASSISKLGTTLGNIFVESFNTDG